MAPVLRHCPCLRPENDDVKVLDYSHSNIEDVPNEVFGFERTLEELYLDANQIKDLPRPLFHCHGLRKLNLSDNEVQSLPPAVASLINLEQLDISKNGVLEIPDNIKGCKCLSMIDASVNPLGKLPEGFTQLINLQELYLNDTFLEYLPANFGRLCRLKILELRENHLKVLPKSMARLTDLSRLDIGQNDFTDLPEVIGNLPRLVELWCDCNNISCLPPFLGGLKKLAYLDASKNRIYDVADEIEGCSSLCDLTLSSNRIKELPDGIANLRKLTVLRVDSNRLTCLPVNIGNLIHLEEFVLSSNDLSKLPFTMGLLRNLKTLIADDNLLEELPCEMGSCQKLTILSLRDNKLLQIPDELGHISALKVINLSGNLLQYLPFSIAKLPNLQALWLSENQNKPLVPLQSDTDRMTGQKVLTCFMLPQVPLEEDGPPPIEGKEADDINPEGKGRQLIKFAFDLDKDQPSKLVRAPTPYPKELKAHARHARNYALKKQGFKDCDINQRLDKNVHLNHANMEILRRKGAPPDIMVMPSGPPSDVRAKVKEAAVVTQNAKSPPSSPSHPKKQMAKSPKDRGGENLELQQQQHNASNPNLHSINTQSSVESSGSDVPVKALGRRDSRGDGSSSENTSSSPVASPKTSHNSRVKDQTTEGHFKKNSATTGSGKRDTWMRQRLLKQGSGDSDRGYRSDHEVYLAERDQYGIYGAHSDGYASDWEAFMAKQTYAPTANNGPMPHPYGRPPGPPGYRGNAEGQEIQPPDIGMFWPGYQYSEGQEPNPGEQYISMNQQGYWQTEAAAPPPPPPQYYNPYDPNQPYQMAQGENHVYYYPPEENPVQPVDFYQPPTYHPSPPQPQVWPQAQRPPAPPPPAVVVGSRTLPRRIGGSSPRMKRAQCLSIQAPLHGSPQEYHLMPQPAGNIRQISPGNSPLPGRSPSPRMESKFSYPVPRIPSQQNAHIPQYAPYPITSQPVNAIQFPPPPSHPAYYNRQAYQDMQRSYPPMTPPRMKHMTHVYVTNDQQPSYDGLPPGVHNSSYYAGGGMQQAMDDQSIKQFGVDTRNSAGQPQYAPAIVDAESVIIPDSNLQYRSGSIPMQIQHIEYESENNSIGAIPQQLNRSVPCINIIPSNSPPYMSTASMEQQINEILQGANTQEDTSENSNSKIINEHPQNNELGFDEAVHKNPNGKSENVSESCQSSSLAPSSENQQHHHYSSVPIENRTNQTLAYSETQNLHVEDNRSPRSSPQNVSESQKCIPGVYKAMPMRSNSFKNTKPAAMVPKNDTNGINPESERRVPPNGSTDATESSGRESNYANINPAEYHDYQNLSTMSRAPGLTGIIKNLNKDKQNSRSTNSASDKSVRNCVSFEDQSQDLKSNISFDNVEFNHPQAVVCDTSQAKNPINTKIISSSETQSCNNISICSSVNKHVDSNSNASTNGAPLSVTKKEDVGFHETKKSGVVSAMANTINRKEVIAQQSLSSLPKPGHPINVSTSKTYAISSLDDDSPIEKAANTKLPAYKMETDINYKKQTVGNGTTQPGGQFSSHAQIPQNESHIPTENQQFAAGTVSQKDIKNQLNSSNKQQQQQLGELESNTKGQGTDKRFQKVLPPFDKTHQLKSANRNTSSPPNPQTCPATSASSEQSSKSSTVIVQSNISKETTFSADSSEMNPSLVQPNPEQIPVNIHKNDAEISKPPLALPPKPQPMSTGSPNVPLHSKSSSNKIASVTQHLINCISKTAPLESTHVSNNEIMPDLLNRVALEEKTQLLFNEDKNLGDIENLKSEDKVLNYKIGLSNKIISPDQEKNYITESENTEPGSPKSPKKNSWFFGSHKNTLVLSVAIAKNPGIGFTVEGGIGTPKYPTRPADSGIYVSNVAADGPASGGLRPGDKILQANGIDFSCLHLEKATSFLNTNEATLSLLISRE